ncbi:HAMP domain-containing histidine kinase [Desulfovibrio sp. OttesenSCG-928-C06]|nr:HAMP domain-containing histidine kinase [Desulfovibrio sp. OttesenSCG-928-C06]
MRLFPRLWQRVFAYAILLVLVSHLVSFVIFRFGAASDIHVRLITELASNIVSALEGKGRESLQVMLEFFNNPPSKLWIELPDGTVAAGEPTTDFTFQARRSMQPARAPENNIAIFSNDVLDTPYLAEVPVQLKDGGVVVCILLEKRPPPPMRAIFLQGLIAVCIIGGALGIWVTWRIARPLRKLSSDVLRIGDGDLEARVSERGPEEIAQVARSVNRMAHSLLQNIKGMRELVANISHEMRSPLARMNISAAIIEEGLTALAANNCPDAQASAPDGGRLILDASGRPLASVHIEYVQREIAHMEKLVDLSLLNSKLDLQHHALDLKTVDFSILCMDMALRHEAMFADKKLLLRLDIQPEIWVSGDESLISLVISNLMDNAAKYTKEGGLVHLRLDEHNDYVRLCLENEHSGLAEGVLARLFEPFFRGEGTGESDGAGLGLTLVRKIALCHNGGATVENSENGLLFCVYFPRTGAENADFIQWVYSRHSASA